LEVNEIGQEKNEHPTTSNKKTNTLRRATKKRTPYDEQQKNEHPTTSNKKTNTLQQATKKRTPYDKQNQFNKFNPIQQIQPYPTK
jgi:hypothetical protein